ncbi:MAG: helix-turn-helix domain-containing protein [Burkholderiales bacterium]|nr:helix-turn-helix domain-containing protein [Burkholderiales bacterium]
MSGEEAAALLGIKPQTLYTYVSRGLIQSLPTLRGRRRAYVRADVERLRMRPRARLAPGALAASAMYAGEPIIATGITEITARGPRYRGCLATELASAQLPFESVAELLWTGELHEEPILWNTEPLPAGAARLLDLLDTTIDQGSIVHLLSLFALAISVSRGSRAERLRSSSTVMAARQLIQVFGGCFGYLSPARAYAPARSPESVAETILRASGLPVTEERLHLLNGMMVLIADHELSPATFVARVAASSGADMHACVVSAIEASSGRHIGEIYDRTEDFVAGAGSKDELIKRVCDLQKTGRVPPGFHQPIYPEGDPRTATILDLALRMQRPSRHLETMLGFMEEAEARFGLKPRAEFGVVALAAELGFPHRASAGLFVISRTAGWVAHVLEQRLSNALLRPRAKFVDG